MRTGNLIVFGPGFRHVWKFKFDAVPVFVLVIAFTMAVLVMGAAGYVAPMLAGTANDHSSRLFVENGTLLIENRAAQLQLQQLAERARKLEEETSRIAAELAE
jgi:hypothetical protein